MPVKSIIDYADDKLVSRNDYYILGLADQDVDYMNSLNIDELNEFKSTIMRKCGIRNENEVELILDSIYNEIISRFTDEEILLYNRLIDSYIELPEGIYSIEDLGILHSDVVSKYFGETCIYTAIGIDRFGRKLYDSTHISRATELQCKKYFATRLAIASIAAMAGMIIPGPGWAVAAAVMIDAAGAAADYYRCVKGN